MKRTAMVMLVFAALYLATGVAGAQVAAATAGDQVAAATPPAETPAIPATAVLQNITGPTYADLNCAGFITSEAPSQAIYVSGGWETPHATKFSDRDYVYLSGGTVQVNSLYTILRHIHDPNRFQAFENQYAVASASGEPYAEVAHVRVAAVRGQNVGVAQVEYSCEPIVSGDFAVPFVEKTAVTLPHTIMFDRFASPNGKAIGQIVMAKDFDQYLATGKKAYINIGADKGLKVGDYLRGVRNYEDAEHNEVDTLSFKASTTEDTQKTQRCFTGPFA